MTTLIVNGETREITAAADTPLIYVLRGELGLTGTKLGCGLEQCGACAVIANGEIAMSCSRELGTFDGAEITTVEGISSLPVGAAVQRAFVVESAAQCGYCTAGLVVAVTDLLARNRKLDDATIREALTPHLCRCGSHASVLRAVHRAIASLVA